MDTEKHITINQVKEKYIPGTKIKLIEMAGEPQMKPGIIGTVTYVDDIGQIHISWETGSGLALDSMIDKFEII